MNLSRDLENKTLYGIVGFFIAMLLCGVVYFWKNDFQHIIIVGQQMSFHFFLAMELAFSIMLIYFIIMNQRKKRFLAALKILVDFFIDYRYRIAIGMFIILVALGVNFSSIASWEMHIFEKTNSIEFGEARAVRSDEWLVQTPWILSQYDNGFPTLNKDIRVDGQNMLFMSTKPPILHISTIGNPYNWGYFILPVVQGYSWHWVSKLLLLLLFSYEFLFIITKGSRYVSFVGAFWIAFSPPIAWWFSTSIVEITIAFQALFVGIYYYFKTKKPLFKIALIGLIIIFGLNFTLDLYPAFQIFLGYVFLGLLLYLFYENRQNIHRIDIFAVAFVIIIVGTVTAMTIIPSLPDITILMSTSYPGKREMTGGGMTIFDFSRYLYSWCLPFKNVPVETLINNCAASAFVTFIPVAVVIICKSWMKKSEEYNYAKIFLFFYILFSLWALVPFPKIFAKITLLSMVTAQMALIGVGLLGVYISAIVISQLDSKALFKRNTVRVITFALGCYYLVALYFFKGLDYLGIIGVIFTLVVFSGMNYFILMGKQKIVLVGICIIAVAPGFFVNPINIGLAPILETSVAKSIQEVVKEDPEGLWMGYNTITLADYVLAQGGKVLNSVHNYPNNELWAKISNDPNDYEIYNRFSHIQIVFDEFELTKFELIGMDYTKITLNIQDLEELNIKYILSYDGLEKFNNEKLTFERKSQNSEGTLIIYEVVHYN